MRAFGWRTQESETVRSNAMQIEPGRREAWWWAIRHRLPNIEEMLNQIGVP
jgi:hypothetical protein